MPLYTPEPKEAVMEYLEAKLPKRSTGCSIEPFVRCCSCACNKFQDSHEYEEPAPDSRGPLKRSSVWRNDQPLQPASNNNNNNKNSNSNTMMRHPSQYRGLEQQLPATARPAAAPSTAAPSLLPPTLAMMSGPGPCPSSVATTQSHHQQHHQHQHQGQRPARASLFAASTGARPGVEQRVVVSPTRRRQSWSPVRMSRQSLAPKASVESLASAVPTQIPMTSQRALYPSLHAWMRAEAGQTDANEKSSAVGPPAACSGGGSMRAPSGAPVRSTRVSVSPCTPMQESRRAKSYEPPSGGPTHFVAMSPPTCTRALVCSAAGTPTWNAVSGPYRTLGPSPVQPRRSLVQLSPHQLMSTRAVVSGDVGGTLQGIFSSSSQATYDREAQGLGAGTGASLTAPLKPRAIPQEVVQLATARGPGPGPMQQPRNGGVHKVPNNDEIRKGNSEDGDVVGKKSFLLANVGKFF